ncbi:MAG: hypothetical protein CMK32_10075 [Porticoccaceae bacterium]|nr:hypothetical protein [Porticoccaceae bacterium]
MRQKITEIFRLARLCGSLGCESYLEVGCADGETFLSIGSTMKKAVAVDMPGMKWGTVKTGPVLARRVSDMRTKLGVDSHLIIGDSSDDSVVDRAMKLGPYDLVFIDGDHTYDGVKRDYENYGPMATKAIAFHDIIGNGMKFRDGSKVEVPILWKEISSSLKTVEFSETWGQMPMGIGVILVGER